LKFDALKDELKVYNRTMVLGPEFVRYRLKLQNFHVRIRRRQISE